MATWFAAASGPTCRAAPAGDRTPGVVGAISCKVAGISAVFSQVGSATDARQFLPAQARLHNGAVLTAWTSGRVREQGQVLFFVTKGVSTLIWAYDGRPYLGQASSGSRAGLEQWWTALGRSVVSEAGR